VDGTQLKLHSGISSKPEAGSVRNATSETAVFSHAEAKIRRNWKILPSRQDFQRSAEEKNHQGFSTTRRAVSKDQS